jgi:hypothetical protein
MFAQRINSSGAVQWTANGAAICTAPNDRYSPKIVSDGAGGAVIAWSDMRSGGAWSDMDIYVQRVDPAGAVQWAVNGVPICTAAGTQYAPTIISDGAGGAIVAWEDSRDSLSGYDIYAQRIDPSGTVKWTANGAKICTEASNQSTPTMIMDGAGGAIITWYDRRSGSKYDIYAQRISAPGNVLWTTDGEAICVSPGDKYSPVITGDGAYGAIIAWQDYREGSAAIYVQRVHDTPPAGPGLSYAKAYPNPFHPGKHTKMRFVKLTAGAVVGIYTLSGEKVAEVTAGSNADAEWLVQNTAGLPVASGVYLAYISDGTNKKILKIAVER